MGCCLKILGISSVLFSIAIGLVWQCLNEIPQLPDIKQAEYWAGGTPKPYDKTIRPFKINIPDSELKDFEMRLNNTRAMTEPLAGIGFQYGFNTKYLNKLLTFWKTKYSWRERETLLNTYPQFKTQISGLNIHFIHVKAQKQEGKTVIPLLLLHGWPGTVREFYSIIPMLTTPRANHDFTFELIIPSLPGYGFSDGVNRPGLGAINIGVIFNELMSRLGYEKYYIQGGDWGAIIGRSMAVLYPERVLGYHSNMCVAGSRKAHLLNIIAYLFPSYFMDESKIEIFSNQFSHILLETGYLHLQATKPDTVGVALTDSPAGLAAYILEKFSTWTDKTWRDLEDGGLTTYDTKALLDNVMIYWFTKSITTSMRLYSEILSKKYYELRLDDIPVTVPTGCIKFPNELLYLPDVVVKTGYHNLIQITDAPKGGHFAAFEVPDILADNIWDFIKLVKEQERNQMKSNKPGAN